MARLANQLRPVRIQRRFLTAAPGSVLIQQGRTRVLCTASLDDDIPPWLKKSDPPQGWVTAEYRMLPGSVTRRKSREPDGRATEIQRLIGRALRCAVDLKKMPGLQIICDCDVLCADGSTRTTAITGAYVALADALALARARGLLRADPLRGPVAAASVGMVDGRVVVDLDARMDTRADVDMNVVMDHRGRFIEVQGTAERKSFQRRDLDRMLRLAARAIRKLMAAQRRALRRR